VAQRRTRARASGGPWGLLLAPGASAGRDQGALVAIDGAVSESGGLVRRIDFPYRLAGRRAPDKAEVLVAAVMKEATSFATEMGLALDRLFAGGRSMGGRICSMAVAQGMTSAGLVLVSYPLHPPSRPDRSRADRSRTGHFADLGLPCLFVSGTRDAFASPAELEAAVAMVPGPVTVEWVEGGDHGLRGRDDQVAGLVSRWLTERASAPPFTTNKTK
jgi:uncharacterized protein